MRKIQCMVHSTKTFNIDLVDIITGDKVFGPIDGGCNLAKLLGINQGYFCKFLKGEYETCKNWKKEYIEE